MSNVPQIPLQGRPLTEREVRQQIEAGIDSACATTLRLPQGVKYLRRMATRKVRSYFAEELINYCIAQNIHLQALRKISAALGNPLAGVAGVTVLDLADLAAEAIKKGLAAEKEGA